MYVPAHHAIVCVFCQVYLIIIIDAFRIRDEVKISNLLSTVILVYTYRNVPKSIKQNQVNHHLATVNVSLDSPADQLLLHWVKRNLHDS
jgi:hypothetical protein